MSNGDTSDLIGVTGDFDTVILTEHGNRIEFEDKEQDCNECDAEFLSGDDEVLVIESGNPKKPGSGYGPQKLKTNSTDENAVAWVGPDGASRGGNWSDETPDDWQGAETRESWKGYLSPFQKNKGCEYKAHVVRRELVHGSYEEHIYGDVHTTIEGTWFSKIKGNLWDTFYGYCHEDFNEHFEEIFYSTKAEVQKGDIVEYNYGESREYYYGNVINTYGKVDAPITVNEYYHANVQSQWGDPGSPVTKTELNFGAVTEANMAAKNEFNFGFNTLLCLATLNLGLATTINLGIVDICARAFLLENDPINIKKTALEIGEGGVILKKNGVDIEAGVTIYL